MTILPGFRVPFHPLGSGLLAPATAETTLRSAIGVGVFNSGARQHRRRDGGATQDGDGGRHTNGTILERVDDAVVIRVLDVDVIDPQQDVAFVQILTPRSIQNLLDFLTVDGVGDGKTEAHVALGYGHHDDLGWRQRQLRWLGAAARASGTQRRCVVA